MGKGPRLNALGGETLAGLTKSVELTATKLNKIMQMSRERPDCEYRWLMPHFSVESLRACFNELDGRKAVGADRMNKEEFGVNLENRLVTLIEAMKSMSYRPGPVREALIPKEGKPGATRPLGISNIEDKIVQSMFAKVLNCIYEPVFLDCSYGFRPKRNCHDAIKSLSSYLHRYNCEVVIDVDLENYFGTIDHAHLVTMLRDRIKDERFIRYIVRMLKAGVLRNGELQKTDEGSSQGSVCSPILSNVYGHYVIDQWFDEVVKTHCRGRIELFRYCDDMVICCQFRDDAERVRRALTKRLAKFSLKLNPEKTKLVSFSRPNLDQGKRQGTFDFLGFTFYLGKTRKGKITAKLKTSRKRLRSKLGKVKQWMMEVRHQAPMKLLWKTFIKKLAGHIQYYGVSFNIAGVREFIWRATAVFFKWINRRSQKRSLTWEKFDLFRKQNPLPHARVIVSLF